MASEVTSPRQFKARVEEVESISHDVYRVTLHVREREALTFHSGQYLSVVLPDSDPCYFSIASAPDAELLELHIQATPQWVSAQKVMDELMSGADVTLHMPHGRACLGARPDKPLLLVAAGTGFAQMKSILDFLYASDYPHLVQLFWGVRHTRDMYLRNLAQQWQNDWPQFTFTPVVGDNEDNDWSGHHDQLVESVLASSDDWSNVRVIASGSPTMVYTLMDALVDAGLPEYEFYSDVLEYAPRD